MLYEYNVHSHTHTKWNWKCPWAHVISMRTGNNRHRWPAFVFNWKSVYSVIFKKHWSKWEHRQENKSSIDVKASRSCPLSFFFASLFQINYANCQKSYFALFIFSLLFSLRECVVYVKLMKECCAKGSSPNHFCALQKDEHDNVYRWACSVLYAQCYWMHTAALYKITVVVGFSLFLSTVIARTPQNFHLRKWVMSIKWCCLLGS